MNGTFRKWLHEGIQAKTKTFYVLVGPPAVGKSTWIENNVENSGKTYGIVSRDQIIEDEIFPKFKLSNEDLFGFYPPKDSKINRKVEGYEKYGKVVLDERGKLAYEKIVAANKQLEKILQKQTKSILDARPEIIVIDAINATEEERRKQLDLVKDLPEYKKVAIYFSFAGYESIIKKRAAERDAEMKKQFGKDFGRKVSDVTYEKIFSRITIPTKSEGFDDVQSHDTFKTNKEKMTAETATTTFRKYLQEKEVSIESAFGVIKRGSGLNINYVMIDTIALKEYCQDLADAYKTEKRDPNITKEDLINNRIVISAVKIAENTNELKAEFGTCMDASHVKVSAVNKRMSGKGYGRKLYKIVMSEHPEGITPDRDFVSPTALKAWQKMAPELSVKKVAGSDKFDDIKNPKTPPKDDDCVIHTRDEYADMSVLDKAYIYSGADTASFLSKGEAALQACEDILEGMWTVESLADMIIDSGMSLYDIAIGYEGPLQEAKLSKIWRRRAIARAKRHDREYPNKIDKKWALKQQQKWNKTHPELEEEYLKEIEHAKGLVDSTKEYLNKIRAIRKQKMEAKGKSGMPPKFGPGTPEKAKSSISVPLEPVHGKGVAGGYREKMKKLKKKMPGSATVAPGETGFGGLGEETVQEQMIDLFINELELEKE